jgi:hypothetical protein
MRRGRCHACRRSAWPDILCPRPRDGSGGVRRTGIACLVAENAADHFSAYAMLQFGKDQAKGLITGAAYSYQQYVQKLHVRAPCGILRHPRPQRNASTICSAEPMVRTQFCLRRGFGRISRARNCKSQYDQVTIAFHDLIHSDLDEALEKQVLDKGFVLDRRSTRRPIQRAAGAKGWLRRTEQKDATKGQKAFFLSWLPHHLSEEALCHLQRMVRAHAPQRLQEDFLRAVVDSSASGSRRLPDLLEQKLQASGRDPQSAA